MKETPVIDQLSKIIAETTILLQMTTEYADRIDRRTAEIEADILDICRKIKKIEARINAI